MADLSTTAREAALYFEVKLYAFRKTRDGTVVSFVLHPQEIPDALATADIGARLVLAVVALPDNEEPKR